MKNKCLLVVGDDAASDILLIRKLNASFFQVHEAGTAWKALALIEQNEYDLIISEIQLGDMSGISLASIAQNVYHQNQPFWFISSRAMNHLKIGHIILEKNINFFPKPFDYEALLNQLSILENRGAASFE